MQFSRRSFIQSAAAAQAAPPVPVRPWWLRPVRMFHPNMSEADVRAIDVKKFVENCAATHCDSVVVSAGGIYAFYPSRVKYHYMSRQLDGRDFLGEVVEHGHAAGLKVVARVDFSKAREEVFRDHPDWFSRRRRFPPERRRLSGILLLRELPGQVPHAVRDLDSFRRGLVRCGVEAVHRLAL